MPRGGWWWVNEVQHSEHVRRGRRERESCRAAADVDDAERMLALSDLPESECNRSHAGERCCSVTLWCGCAVPGCCFLQCTTLIVLISSVDVCMVLQFWSPSRAQCRLNRETGLVPAVRDTRFPTPLVVRIGATSCNAALPYMSIYWCFLCRCVPMHFCPFERPYWYVVSSAPTRKPCQHCQASHRTRRLRCVVYRGHLLVGVLYHTHPHQAGNKTALPKQSELPLPRPSHGHGTTPSSP